MCSQTNYPLALSFHHITPRFLPGLNHIRPNKFSKIINILSSSEKNIVTTNKVINKDSILLTFDDGYESVYTHAYPLMEKNKMKGIIFPIAAYIGITNSWDYNFLINPSSHLNNTQLTELDKSGWEIGCHGYYHYPYSGMNMDEIKGDILKSKIIIEDLIGKEIRSFCIPFNSYNPVLLNMIMDAGFKYIFIQNQFYSNNMIRSNNVIYRHSILRNTSLNKIKQMIEQSNSKSYFFDRVVQFCSNATIGVKELV